MRILVYKRTHTGDPNFSGEFGCNDCMGRVRSYRYDAVIGIGGVSDWDGNKIAGKLTWVGIKPIRGEKRKDHRAEIVRFQEFFLWDENGPFLETIAPVLAQNMFQKNTRFKLLEESDDEYTDALKILDLARSGKMPASQIPDNSRVVSNCRSSLQHPCKERKGC